MSSEQNSHSNGEKKHKSSPDIVTSLSNLQAYTCSLTYTHWPCPSSRHLYCINLPESVRVAVQVFKMAESCGRIQKQAPVAKEKK